MHAKEIHEYAQKGGVVIWIDDKQDAPLTPEYLERNTVAIVDSLETGRYVCSELHKRERGCLGRAVTRYRLSGRDVKDVCSEDLTYEQMEKIVSQMPISEQEKTRILEEMKKS